jgi:hypothetical protein
MNSKYPEAQIIIDSFSFLEELGYILTRSESLNYGSYVEFKGNGIRIYLGFDFKDYYFYFNIYNNENLKYSEDSFGKDIIPFSLLDSTFRIDELQPNREIGYEAALLNNAILLKSYLAGLTP